MGCRCKDMDFCYVCVLRKMLKLTALSKLTEASVSLYVASCALVLCRPYVLGYNAVYTRPCRQKVVVTVLDISGGPSGN